MKINSTITSYEAVTGPHQGSIVGIDSRNMNPLGGRFYENKFTKHVYYLPSKNELKKNNELTRKDKHIAAF